MSQGTSAKTEVKTSFTRRAAIVIAAAGIMISMGSGVALAANIQGTDREDTLIGTNRDDTIRGFKSNDELRGLLGDDRLFGNENKDNLVGGGGRDALDGGTGDDRMIGGSGNDFLRGANDAGDVDRVSCSTGTDRAVIDQYDILLDDSCETVTIKATNAPQEPELPEEDAA